MNLRNFQTQISSHILNRGKEYYSQGAVITLEEEESGVWDATVEGSDIYSVEVELSDNNDIDRYYCDCPHEADVCKHIVAVFYELKDRVKTVKFPPAKKEKTLSFNQLLEKVTVSELKAFVELFAKSDKSFKNQFELHFSHKDEKVDLEKKYAELVKKAIRSSMSQGYVDYYSAGDLSRKLDRFLDIAQEALENQNFKDALVISRIVLKHLIEDVIPNVDDSNGDIGDTTLIAISIMKSVAESELCGRELKENMHDLLAKKLTSDSYFDYGDFGYNCFEIFRYLSVQLDRPEAFLAFGNRPVRQRTESWTGNYRAEFFIKQFILFFREIGNTLEAEKLIRQNIDIVEIRQDVVDELIENKKFIDAKELIYQGIVLAEKKSHPGTVMQWQKALLRIANLEGDIVTLRSLNLLFAFDRGFEKEYYQNWKKSFPKAELETAIGNLVQKIADEVELEAEKNLNNYWWSKNYTLLYRLAPIYVQEKQWHKLYELVEAYPSLEILLNYMKYLASDYQPQLTDLLCPALILAGDRADSRSGYAQVASNMKNIIKLMPASKARILEAAQILRTKYPRRPAMQDELKVVW